MGTIWDGIKWERYENLLRRNKMRKNMKTFWEGIKWEKISEPFEKG